MECSPGHPILSPLTAMMKSLILALLLLPAASSLNLPAAPGDSTTCSNISVTLMGGGQRTATVKATHLLSAIEGTCSSPNHWVKIEVTMVCGSASCDRSATYCSNTDTAFEFRCEGKKFKVTPGHNLKWGERPNGTAECSDLKVENVSP